MEDVMKKFIAILIALTTVLSLATVSLASECAHENMIVNTYAATCMMRERTVSECPDCGYYNEEFAIPEADIPEGVLTFVFDANVDLGGMLTVTCTAYNNPGVYSNRFTLKYNPDALTPISVSNGDVWADGAYLSTINTEKNYIRYFADDWGNNTNNGVVFQAHFSANALPAEWGLSVTTIAEDFIDFETSNNVPFKVISTMSEGFGTEHRWDDGVVTVEPTTESEGVMTYTCVLCGETKTEAIPVIEAWLKGDINNDGKINLADIYLAKTLVANGDVGFDPLAVDAADMNSDGKINLADIMLLKVEILK